MSELKSIHDKINVNYCQSKSQLMSEKISIYVKVSRFMSEEKNNYV